MSLGPEVPTPHQSQSASLPLEKFLKKRKLTTNTAFKRTCPKKKLYTLFSETLNRRSVYSIKFLMSAAAFIFLSSLMPSQRKSYAIYTACPKISKLVETSSGSNCLMCDPEFIWKKCGTAFWCFMLWFYLFLETSSSFGSFLFFWFCSILH